MNLYKHFGYFQTTDGLCLFAVRVKDAKGKPIHIGKFSTEEAAAEAYDLAMLALYGISENFPREHYTIDQIADMSKRIASVRKQHEVREQQRAKQRQNAYTVDRDGLLNEFDQYAKQKPKVEYQKPESVSEARAARRAGEYYPNNLHQLVTAYSLPISLC